MNLKVDIAGVTLNNPIIAGSGTFGFGVEMSKFYDLHLLGGLASKAVTLHKRDGNPSPRIAEVTSGILNAVGLQNPGVDGFLAEELPRMKTYGTRIIVNVAGSTEEEYVAVLEKLQGSGIDMVELNISCPNVKQGAMAFGTSPESVASITRLCKKACDVPLMVKLTPNVTDIVAIAQAAEQAGADALSLINTLTGMAVDVKTRRPILANITGGMSGPAIKPIALRMVYQVSQAVSIPIVGMGGITSGTDVVEFLLCGANAVTVGTGNLMTPTACTDICEELRAFMQEQGVKDVNELVGALQI